MEDKEESVELLPKGERCRSEVEGGDGLPARALAAGSTRDGATQGQWGGFDQVRRRDSLGRDV